MSAREIPVVMVFAGNDPTGGAGIQADIEAIASMGCQAAPVITALTVQDTHDVARVEPVSARLVVEQARAVLDDMPVACFKLGLLGGVENIAVIHTLLREYPDVPVVLDPVLRAGGGHLLSTDELVERMQDWLLPQTTVLTPNSVEARVLAPVDGDLDACGRALLEQGSEMVLITGTHEDTAQVENRIYGDGGLLEVVSWERLPYDYHGSGCTLASAIAGLLAQGLEPFNAAIEAQEYAWESLKNAYRIGRGQRLPNRLFWARAEN